MSDPCNNLAVVVNKDPSLKGTTLFVEDEPVKQKKGGHRMDTGGCLTPTAVYVPANHDKTKDLNVILWFHGWHVADYQHDIFVVDTASGKTMLRESVDAAEKDVVLVVPFIGHREAKSDPAFVLPNYNNDSSKLEAYLKKLCDTIKGTLGTTTIGRLVIACHSGSGDIMMRATAALGTLEPYLKECWGYDCMYGNDYKSWMSSHSKQSLYFYQGSGSYSAEFRKHWEFAYGTPRKPKKPRLNHVFLAPGTKYKPADMECLTDAEVFQSFEAIQLKKDNKQKLSDYESFRLNDLDPLLDSNPTKWASTVDNSVKSHYVIVQDLVTPRIVGLFDTVKPSGANVIAQCKSGIRAAPPLPQKPGQGGAGRSK